MSRKAVLGRAALSFDTDDGILDIDQILNTTPWNQIDDFVQRNFMQNILDQFNEQMTLDPKRVPAEKRKPSPRSELKKSSPRSELKKPSPRSEKRKTSPRSGRKNGASQTKEENPVEINNNEPSSVDGLEAAVEESKDTPATIKSGEKEEVNDTEKKKSKTRKAVKRPTLRKVNAIESRESENEEQLEKVSSSKAMKAVANGSTRKKRSKGKDAEDLEKMESTSTEVSGKAGSTSVEGSVETEIVNSTANGSEELEYPMAMKASRNSESVSLFQTSTPKREDLSISDLVKEEKTMEDPKNTQSIFHTTNLNNNNNCPEFLSETKKGKGKKKVSEKCKLENATEKKHNIEKPIKKEKETKRTGKSRSKTTKMALKSNERDEKMAVDIGKKKIGKFEKRLHEKEERRRERKILRHEKKAQRAMDEFSRHVASIAKKMGYLPGKDFKDFRSSAGRYDLSRQSSYSSCCSNTSCSCSCSSSSSYTSCSCSCSSSSSYTSCSCSSNCKSCSCTDSSDSYGTDEYSEYTLCSSSECGCDCDSSSTSKTSNTK